MTRSQCGASFQLCQLCAMFDDYYNTPKIFSEHDSPSLQLLQNFAPQLGIRMCLNLTNTLSPDCLQSGEIFLPLFKWVLSLCYLP